MTDFEQMRFPKLIDIETVAEMMAVGVRYVRRLVAERKLEYIKLGRHLRFDEEKVREFIDRRRNPPEEPE